MKYRYLLRPGDMTNQWEVQKLDEKGMICGRALFWDQGQAARFAAENNMRSKKQRCPVNNR